MKKEKETQIIIVNRSLVDDSIQIVIPPFRPINMYELEDNFDGVVDEIESYVLDKTVAKQVIGFVSAFKDSLEEKDVLPIVEYFMKHEINNRDPQHMVEILESLKDFIEMASDENRLMH